MKNIMSADAAAFLAGGGEMGALFRSYDWSSTTLGQPGEWPQSLRTAVSLMLSSRYPMFIAWGPSLAFLYNEGYAPILGAKHPQALGQPFERVWSEIWDDIRPLVDRALSGESTFNENMHLVMERSGFPEDTWYTFSYSPVRDETGGVGGMFCACQETTSQVLAEKRLIEQAERQRSLFEQAPGFVAILTGPEHVFEFANESYARVAGRRDFVGRNVREVFPDLKGQGFFEALDRVYGTGERFVAEGVPLRLQPSPDKPPEDMFLDFIYEPMRDERGLVTGIFVEGHNVTAAHLALETQVRQQRHMKLLIDELNHRVKNTLAIVQGLAHQTFRGNAATGDSRRAFEGRLMALASAHTLLTQENWESASLTDVITKSLDAIAAAANRVYLQGPDTRLIPKTAVTLGLAIHELATNSFKYGALSVPEGSVKVSWTISTDGKRLLRLRWQEMDGPVVSSPETTGFGRRMIERALGSELNGDVKLQFLVGGVICDILAELPDVGGLN